MNPRRDNCFHCAAKTTPDLNKIKVPPKLNPVDANPAAATLRFITGPHVSRHQHRHYKTHGKKNRWVRFKVPEGVRKKKSLRHANSVCDVFKCKQWWIVVGM